jgi:Phage tail protein
MLTRVDIQNATGDLLSLPLADVSGGYEVQDIEGLDPVKATLVSSQMAQVDGAQPQSSRRETRNITMKLGLQPNYKTTSVAGLRQALYKYMMPKSVITMTFYMDGIAFAQTVGTVESLESSMFSKDPVVNISIICYDPDFYALEPISVDLNSVLDLTSTSIFYEGTSPCGVIITVNPNRDLTGFQIYNTTEDNTQQVFDYEGTILNSNTVVICSIPLQKSVVLTTAGVPFSALYAVQPNSDWITLEAGNNDLRLYTDGDPFPYTVTYTPKYGGL